MYLQKVIGRKTKIFEKIGSGSIGQRHGSADPDPYLNATDPQHWFTGPNMITTLHTAVVQPGYAPFGPRRQSPAYGQRTQCG
jgi:hypothetical protein